MYPFMHVFVPVLFSELPQLKDRLKIQRFALIIGSMLPDLIDKPLSIFWQISGRGLGHTPLYLFLLLGIFYLLTKNSPITLSLAIGSLFHLLLDIPGVPWLAPFIDYDFGYLEDPINGWWITLLTNPMVQITEIVGVVGLFAVTIKYRLIFDFERIKSFLLVIHSEESSISINKKSVNFNVELKNSVE